MQSFVSPRSLAGVALPFYLLITPIAIHAQVVITSGTAQTFWNMNPGHGGSGPTNLAGADFSFSSQVPLFTNSIATVVEQTLSQTQLILNPSQPVTASLEFVNGEPSPPAIVTYKGASYLASSITMNFSAAPATVNIPAGEAGELLDSISNMPFTMSGTLSMCPLPNAPYGSACSATGLITLNISGTGIFTTAVFGGTFQKPNGVGVYRFTPPSGFVLDTTTQGNWNGTYGYDGYLLPNGATYLPSYAAVGLQPNYPYTWMGPGPISDARDPQNGACPIEENSVPCTSDRIASAFTWYGTNSVNISITFTDNQVHRVALYLLDWDSTGRQETVTIQQNGQPFDTETFANFHNGQYGAWNLQGNVLITVTPIGPASSTNPGSPVVSGIFFGPGDSGSSVPTLAPNVQPAASVVQNSNYPDTKTQGAWTGTYGANGYLIANGSSQAPTYGTVSQTGGTTYTWAPGTNDPRALQKSPGSAMGIASAFTQYGAQPLSFNVNITDITPHSVSLYLLDWDSSGRQQTITIQDVATGAVLFANTYSGFHNGEFVTWLISGNVTITVTPVGPASSTNPDTAVVSGIFFN